MSIDDCVSLQGCCPSPKKRLDKFEAKSLGQEMGLAYHVTENNVFSVRLLWFRGPKEGCASPVNRDGVVRSHILKIDHTSRLTRISLERGTPDQT